MPDTRSTPHTQRRPRDWTLIARQPENGHHAHGCGHGPSGRRCRGAGRGPAQRPLVDSPCRAIRGGTTVVTRGLWDELHGRTGDPSRGIPAQDRGQLAGGDPVLQRALGQTWTDNRLRRLRMRGPRADAVATTQPAGGRRLDRGVGPGCRWLPITHRCRVVGGLQDRHHRRTLRRAGRHCLVRGKLRRQGSSRADKDTERVGSVRHARRRLGNGAGISTIRPSTGPTASFAAADGVIPSGAADRVCAARPTQSPRSTTWVSASLEAPSGARPILTEPPFPTGTTCATHAGAGLDKEAAWECASGQP